MALESCIAARRAVTCKDYNFSKCERRSSVFRLVTVLVTVSVTVSLTVTVTVLGTASATVSATVSVIV